VVDAARAADRLLASTCPTASPKACAHPRAGRGGRARPVYAVDLVFHNAYGPDKPWFYDPALSGGGCVMDLGVHLVDLALWALDFPRSPASRRALRGRRAARGRRRPRVEDYAVATLELEGGAAVRSPARGGCRPGSDAVISAAFYGTEGGAALRNVGGSFYDFTAERFRGTARETLADAARRMGRPRRGRLGAAPGRRRALRSGRSGWALTPIRSSPARCRWRPARRSPIRGQSPPHPGSRWIDGAGPARSPARRSPSR
jgi:predicted dehydrogenase